MKFYDICLYICIWWTQTNQMQPISQVLYFNRHHQTCPGSISGRSNHYLIENSSDKLIYEILFLTQKIIILFQNYNY